MTDDGYSSTPCEMFGHDAREIYRDDEIVQYVCDMCGAELEDQTPEEGTP